MQPLLTKKKCHFTLIEFWEIRLDLYINLKQNLQYLHIHKEYCDNYHFN